MSGIDDRVNAYKRDVANTCAMYGMEFCLLRYGQEGRTRLMRAEIASINQADPEICMLAIASGKSFGDAYRDVPGDQLGMSGRGFVVGWGGLEEKDFPILTLAAQTVIAAFQAENKQAD